MIAARKIRVVGKGTTAIMMAALACASGPASAKTTLQVSGSVTRGCSLGLQPLMFGQVAFLFPTATAQSFVLVECTPGTTFTLAMDDGQNFNGQRRMIRTGPGFGTYLNYEIYSDAARTRRWGRTAAQTVTRTATGNGKVNLQAYGRANGLVAAGPFRDVVTVTITF